MEFYLGGGGGVLQNKFSRVILFLIYAAPVCLLSYSAHAGIIDTPEHRQAAKTVAEIPNVKQKIISAFDSQRTASCYDIVTRMIAMEMGAAATPMSSRQRFEAAVMYEIVVIAFLYYGESSIASNLQYYQSENNINQISARARECDSLTKRIR